MLKLFAFAKFLYKATQSSINMLISNCRFLNNWRFFKVDVLNTDIVFRLQYINNIKRPGAEFLSEDNGSETNFTPKIA